ncbi:cytochrome P450 [Streptomyces achromogenes]|uniref:cytochrome P450 n=1 Tax=Streptomyces achromogenes TaxID=67255 RepID=UPI0036C3A648
MPLLGHLPGLARGRAAFLRTLRECGDVVEMRLGRRPFYVLNAPEAIHDVLVAQSGKFSKGMLFDQVRPYIGNGLASSDGPFHLRQRRAMQSAFHRERVARYSKTFVEVAGDRVGDWPEGGHGHGARGARPGRRHARTGALPLRRGGADQADRRGSGRARQP